MREAGLRARQKRRYKVTTQSNHHLPVAPNLLDQTFTAERRDAIWLSDITYIATVEGWLYLAVVLDLHSRMIVGWSMQPTLARQLFRWCCASADYRQRLADHGARASMSRRGNCYDQAPVESFFSTLKMKCVQNVVSRRANRRRLLCSITSKYSIIGNGFTRAWATSVPPSMS